MERRIHPSARKHGLADDDILHAIEFALFAGVEEDEDRKLYLGPDQAANMIEVLALLEDDHELVIHAMSVQKKYEPLLRGRGEPDA